MDQKEYSKATLVALRNGLQTHLLKPPFNRTLNLTFDSAFAQANVILNARAKLHFEHVKDCVTYPAIEACDYQKMYTSKVLSNDTPHGLQNKVFFEMAFHFDRKTREDLKELTLDSFEFHDDAEKGCKYVTLATTKRKEKNLKLLAVEAAPNPNKKRLYATGQPNCPVASLEKYLSVLDPTCHCFFQGCKRSTVKVFGPFDTFEDRYWYNGKPLGINAIGQFMKHISINAKLSRVYSNHCIRATAVKMRNAHV